MSVQVAGNFDQSCLYSDICSGDYNINNTFTNGGYRIKKGILAPAKRIVVHPAYKNPSSTYYNSTTPYRVFAFDYCLIQVRSNIINFDKINGKQKVAPAILPLSHIPFSLGLDSEQSTPQECHIAGWGSDESGGQSAVILSAEIDVTSHAYCKNIANKFNATKRRGRRRRRLYQNVDSLYSFCGGTEGMRTDTCKVCNLYFRYTNIY